MTHYGMVLALLLGLSSTTVWADAPKTDLIPELKDIEKIAAEQEAAIRAQSEALQKAQQEKALAEKEAKEAIDKQKALATPAAEATPAKVEPKEAKVQRKVSTKAVKKTPAEPIEKTNPWLAQERRYSFP